MIQTKTVCGACPTFFRATCQDASRDNRDGYLWAGYKLTAAAAGLLYEDFDEETFVGKVEAMQDAIMRRDDATVIAWFVRELPRCMSLVPARRRDQFLVGVYRYAIEEENDVTVV
ncbi:hypothetical protein V5E97_09670 [Singulisphaera sp. Ch08]|uniref:Uncharacterized protein n=1 Tax=Singulisphaera sp. Ch08 TaxID=3120278 RepID=A0AAU7CMG6_9BACT